jgi:hypothetical protein
MVRGSSELIFTPPCRIWAIAQNQPNAKDGCTASVTVNDNRAKDHEINSQVDPSPAISKKGVYI